MNMYWSVYENLESEVLALADNIMFDDAQLKVYSLKIGDLIVRCAVEIESISKALYLQEGGQFPVFDKSGKERDFYFDTDCIDLLVKKWKIDKKKLNIFNPKTDFSPEKITLTPLHKSHKRGTSGSKWKQAYQAIKHDRALSKEQANVRNLLNALGALYILNLYYRNESFWCNIPIDRKSPYANQSKIFMPYICDLSKNPYWLLNSENIDALKTADWIASIEPSMEESVYIKRYTDNSIHQQRKWWLIFCLNGEEYGTLKKIFSISTELSAKNIIKEIQNGYHSDIAKTISQTHIIFEQMELVKFDNMDKTTEIVLNKDLSAYPAQTWKEFFMTDDVKKIFEVFKIKVI